MGRIIFLGIRVALLILIILAFSTQAVQAQDASSLKEAIIAHYKAINTGESESVSEQHRPDFTIFFRDGTMLVAREDIEVANQVGFSSGNGDSDNNEGSGANVIPYNFTAQIYDNVGLATFYLWGTYGSGEEKEEGMWRVSAVWIYEDGAWKEAHHHESPVKIGG